MAVQGVNGYPDFDKWKLGLNQTQQPPVEPSYEIKDPFGLNAYGGVTGVEGPSGAYGGVTGGEGTQGVFGTYRVTPPDGWVPGPDGTTMISYRNSLGYVSCTEHASSPNGLHEKPGFVPRTLIYV